MEHFFRNTLRAVQQHRVARGARPHSPFPTAPLPPLLQQHSEHVMQMLQRRGDAAANGAAAATLVLPGVGLLPGTGLPAGMPVPQQQTDHGEGNGGNGGDGGDYGESTESGGDWASAGDPPGVGGRVPPATRPRSAQPPAGRPPPLLPGGPGPVDLLSGHLLLLRYQLNLALQCQSGPLHEAGVGVRGAFNTLQFGA